MVTSRAYSFYLLVVVLVALCTTSICVVNAQQDKTFVQTLLAEKRYPSLEEITGYFDALTKSFARTKYAYKLEAPNPRVFQMKLQVIDGKKMLYLVMSSVTEARPAVLFTSLHHADEGASVLALLGFIEFLCKNHAHPFIAKILSQRRLVFVPVVNPESYAINYQRQRTPLQNKMMRKNQHNCDSVSDAFYDLGVDINRNYDRVDDVSRYPVPYETLDNFEFENTEKAKRTPSTSYSKACFQPDFKGVRPLSEWENQAMDAIMRTYAFSSALHYHNPGGFIVHPSRYLLNDEQVNIYKTLREALPRRNHYSFGRPVEYFGAEYIGSTGDACDHMVRKYGTHCVTVEVRTSVIIKKLTESTNNLEGLDKEKDWWPLDGRDLTSMVTENLYSSVVMAWVAGQSTNDAVKKAVEEVVAGTSDLL